MVSGIKPDTAPLPVHNAGSRTEGFVSMSMKKTDLAKNMALKINEQMKRGVIPDRFAQGAAVAVEKREQRRLDAAAGLVPFACKLPGELVARLKERALGHEGGLNALMQELLNGALADA